MDPFTLSLFLVMGLLFLYHFVWEPMNYFKRLGIEHETPLPFLGNVAAVTFRRITMPERIEQLYHRFSNVKYFGMYNLFSPLIVIRDPEVIASITVKNFDHFTDHRGFVDRKLDPMMGSNLFSLRGEEWREMRKLLSPSFTSMKMKMMYHLIRDCADSFTSFIVAEAKNGKVYNQKDIFARYTVDVIATCSFGFSIDSMRNPENEFYQLTNSSLNFSSGLSWRFTLGFASPKLCTLLGIKMFSERVHRYFLDVVSETVRTRQEKGITRPDMIQLMMDTKDKDRPLTIEEMTYQAFIFFFAGFDTTSSFLSFAAHEIAVNPEVKEKLQEEIDELARKTNGNPSYEDIKNMQYMEAVLSEVLRLHNVAFTLDRVCVKEFQLPPAKDGAPPVTMKPGDLIWFSPFSLQRDNEYFDDPFTFRPERFLKGDIPSAYMPFGIGPRMCIGNRFAFLEAKLLMFYLLSRCDIEPCPKTQIPTKYDARRFVLMFEKGFWLNFRARNRESMDSNGGRSRKTQKENVS